MLSFASIYQVIGQSGRPCHALRWCAGDWQRQSEADGQEWRRQGRCKGVQEGREPAHTAADDDSIQHADKLANHPAHGTANGAAIDTGRPRMCAGMCMDIWGVCHDVQAS